MRPLARAVVLAAAVTIALVPGQATAQIDTPVGELPVPTTLPPVLGGGPDDGVNPPGSTPTPTVPATTPPTSPPPTEQPRESVDDPGSTSGGRPASSSRRPASGVRSAPVVPGGDGTIEERAAADAAARPAIARLRRVTVPAARQFGFPLGLAVLVLAFLAVQARLDDRDPKLAAAPVTVDDDLLRFQ